MKKLFTLIVAFVLGFAVPSFAATYYGGAAGKNINADDLWFSAVTGSCAGTGGQGVTAATALQAGNTLIANGCTITIPNSSSTTFTASKISCKKDAGANVVDGGSFDYTTSNTNLVIIQADVETGTTSSNWCLAPSGSGSQGLQVGTVGTPITVSGGLASSKATISSTHTVGTLTIYGNINGGTASNASGVTLGGNGPVTINGTVTGGSGGAGLISTTAAPNVTINGSCIGGTGAIGCSNNSTAGVFTINGDCVGSATGGYAGCGSGSGSSVGGLVINGNIVGTTTSSGVTGNAKIKWNPGTLYTNFRYIKMFDGSGNPVYAVIAPNPSDVRYGVTYGWDGSTNLTGTARPLIGGALLLRGVGF